MCHVNMLAPRLPYGSASLEGTSFGSVGNSALRDVADHSLHSPTSLLPNPECPAPPGPQKNAWAMHSCKQHVTGMVACRPTGSGPTQAM